jgi:hypothetical protein
MKVLGKHISDNAERFIKEFTSSLNKPFHFVELPESAPQWGRIGNNPGEYLIGIKTKMPDDAFEFTLCHEVFHAYQLAVGFPNVIDESENLPDIKEFCERLRSNILDLSADDAVRSYGLYDTFVMKRRFTQIMELAASEFAIINNQYAKDLLSIDLLLDMHNLDENKKQPILDILSRVRSDVFALYSEFHVIITENGYDSPKGCFNIMGYIINRIGLWNHCSIEYCNKNIRSYQRFKEYCTRNPMTI